MSVGALAYTEFVPRSNPVPREPARVADAAAAVGLSPMTIWRYLQRGLLTRYTTKGVRRPRTIVDMVELRALLQNPPIKLAEPPGSQ